jgi:hypothetical protein
MAAGRAGECDSPHHARKTHPFQNLQQFLELLEMGHLLT